MNKILASLVAAAWCGSALAQTDDAFKLMSTETRCPEYGTIIRYTTLLVGTNKATFMTPRNWQARTDARERKMTYLSPSLGTMLTLKVTLLNETNAPGAAAAQPAPRILEGCRARVLNRFPGARITEEKPCFANGVQGEYVSFELVNAARQRTLGRLASVPFRGGEIELGFITNTELALAHGEFTSLLNSLKVENLETEKKVSLR